jgi:membrane associated rhomboid family serine protease
VSAAEIRTCYRHPDRETGLSCSECGRPICAECMTIAPVGIRCPDHSGAASGAAKVGRRVSRMGLQTHAFVTRILVGINVGVYLAELVSGSGIYADTGWIFQKGALVASGVEIGGTLQPVPGAGLIPDAFLVGVAHGQWYRMITAAFLHYGPIHLGMNMLAVWWIGRPLEDALGPIRYLLLYLVSGLAGSAGALIANPNAVTVGASGAIFGILGAALVFEQQRTYVLGGSALSIIVLNLVFTFAVPNVSIGGHVGGLIGGALCGLALTRFGRGHAAYGRIGIAGIAGLIAVGVLSVVISYWKVRGYA